MFVYLKSGKPNSNFLFVNRRFLSYRPPHFLNHFLEIVAKVPRPPEKFVEIRSDLGRAEFFVYLKSGPAGISGPNLGQHRE